MRILHIVASLDPAAGGPPVVAQKLAAAQASLGHEVNVSTGDQMPEMRRGIEAAVASAQIVHLHGVWEPLMRRAAAIAHRDSIPYVIAPHGMLDPWSLSQKWLKKRIAMLLGYRRMLNGAAFIHVLNEDEGELLSSLKLTPPCKVIPNAIDPRELDQLPPPQEFYRRLPQLAGRPFVLFLSRLHHKKGLDYLVDAFALIAKQNALVQLVVAGPDQGAEADLRRRVERAGLTDRVHIIGPLYGEEKLAALAAAACFVLPSRQEGFSLAILEAMAARLPVVISKQCHFPQVAEANAGITTELDPPAIADALKVVLGDSTRARQMGQNGARLVRERYTWPRVAEQSIAAYESVVRK